MNDGVKMACNRLCETDDNIREKEFPNHSVDEFLSIIVKVPMCAAAVLNLRNKILDPPSYKAPTELAEVTEKNVVLEEVKTSWACYPSQEAATAR
jgi:hypothetical protein